MIVMIVLYSDYKNRKVKQKEWKLSLTKPDFLQHAILMKKDWKFEYHAEKIMTEKGFLTFFMRIM